MTFKIDLEKVYDKLNWNFIRWVLKVARFLASLISTNMQCVLSSSMTVLWNGDRLEPFQPSRGVRQGDEALVRQLQNILAIIDVFGKVSSQKVNLSKSSIFVSPNTYASLAAALSKMGGIPIIENLGKYLGVPSFHGKIGSNTDDYILEHMRARLERWKAKTLSREMERICKSFIWHGAGEDKRIQKIFKDPELRKAWGFTSGRHTMGCHLFPGYLVHLEEQKSKDDDYCVILNTDGSKTRNPGPAAYAGVFRSTEGR
ncbi:uncharacterized protein LOC110603281 [Manihot esculenta]|uniref:uncharacterized protein LOC110603281 n=1 Tax=Manihot esculenta TaxID=3983 RepID=UPI000B5D0846|nr:uncharacterized protein LOC110603281 [Manihot esculenta]